MKFWRTALVATLVLTVMLSVTGGTIAWFTDEVTSTANVIKSGTLDVKLEYQDVNANEVSDWKDASNETIFNYNKWEPGYTEMKYVKVSNIGSLAFNFKLTVEPTLDTTTKPNLADVIEVYMGTGNAPTTSEALHAYTPVGTISSLVNDEDGVAYGKMLAGDPAIEMWVALHMQESAGNEYQDKSVGNGFNLKLFATQLTYEEDSFDDQYDADANVSVYNEADLEAAIANGGTVKLGGDIALSSSLEVPAGVTVTLDLGGNTLNNANGNAIVNKGTLTLTGNGLVKSEKTYAVNNSGTVTVDGISTTGMYNNGAMTVENVELKNTISDRHGIYHSGSSLVINGGSFDSTSGNELINAANNSAATINGGTFTMTGKSYLLSNNITVNGGTFYGYVNADGTNDKMRPNVIVKGGTFNFDPTSWAADGHVVTNNGDGTWTVSRNAQNVPATEDKAANTTALTNAIDAVTAEQPYINLGAGEYKMPSVFGSKEFTIVGTEDTVIDVTLGAYMDNSTVSFEGVTIKGSTGYANGNGSDYAALYTPNVTYTNCTFDGPFRIGRDGATFINCTFTNLGNDYVWTYGNDCTFENCTFESDGKALLIYSDGGSEVSQVTVKDCVFNATAGAKAGAIANQNCAAIEIQNYGNGVNLTTSGNTIDSDFSGEWRIKAYHAEKPAVIVNDTTYTTIALDGKTMTIDANRNVTVNE